MLGGKTNPSNRHTSIGTDLILNTGSWHDASNRIPTAAFRAWLGVKSEMFRSFLAFLFVIQAIVHNQRRTETNQTSPTVYRWMQELAAKVPTANLLFSRLMYLMSRLKKPPSTLPPPVSHLGRKVLRPLSSLGLAFLIYVWMLGWMCVELYYYAIVLTWFISVDSSSFKLSTLDSQICTFPPCSQCNRICAVFLDARKHSPTHIPWSRSRLAKVGGSLTSRPTLSQCSISTTACRIVPDEIQKLSPSSQRILRWQLILIPCSWL